jgi:hypothetical protein
MSKKHLQNKGFSYGETLLALFIISVGLLTVIKLFQGALSQTLFLRDATVASELSQEGVELVRNIRDNNFAAGGNGFASFSANKHCYVATNSVALNCFANQGDTTGYNLIYSGGSYIATTGAAKFRRYIYVDYNATGPTATIKSFVTWGGQPLPPATGATTTCTIKNQCVYTEVTLTNWRS